MSVFQYKMLGVVHVHIVHFVLHESMRSSIPSSLTVLIHN